MSKMETYFISRCMSMRLDLVHGLFMDIIGHRIQDYENIASEMISEENLSFVLSALESLNEIKYFGQEIVSFRGSVEHSKNWKNYLSQLVKEFETIVEIFNRRLKDVEISKFSAETPETLVKKFIEKPSEWKNIQKNAIFMLRKYIYNIHFLKKHANHHYPGLLVIIHKRLELELNKLETIPETNPEISHYGTTKTDEYHLLLRRIVFIINMLAHIE